MFVRILLRRERKRTQPVCIATFAVKFQVGLRRNRFDLLFYVFTPYIKIFAFMESRILFCNERLEDFSLNYFQNSRNFRFIRSSLYSEAEVAQ